MEFAPPSTEDRKPIRLHFQSKKFFEARFEGITLSSINTFNTFAKKKLFKFSSVKESFSKEKLYLSLLKILLKSKNRLVKNLTFMWKNLFLFIDNAERFLMELINAKLDNGYDLALEEDWGIKDIVIETKPEQVEVYQEIKEAPKVENEIGLPSIEKEEKYIPHISMTSTFPMSLELWDFIDEINNKANELNIAYEPMENSIHISGEISAINEMIEFLKALQAPKYNIQEEEEEEEEKKTDEYMQVHKEDTLGPFMQKELKICNSVKTHAKEIEKQAEKFQLIYENLDNKILIAGQQANILEFLNYMYELTSNTMEEELRKHKEMKILKQDGEFCQNEISVSTFHRIHKEEILTRADDLELICDFGYDVILVSGLSENLKEFKSYLHDVEATAKKALYPKYWDFHEIESFSEIEVFQGSEEFHEVEDLFHKSLNGVRITKLTRVQNKYLMDLYVTMLQKRQEVMNENFINRRLLFHGTRAVKPELIYKSQDTGFDLQYANAGGSYGKGLYFAVNSSYSHNGFTYNVGNGRYQMFLADVFVGKPYKSGPNNMFVKAPQGYDSVEASENFYIIYNNFHSYPLYLIEYEGSNGNIPINRGIGLQPVNYVNNSVNPLPYVFNNNNNLGGIRHSANNRNKLGINKGGYRGGLGKGPIKYK